VHLVEDATRANLARALQEFQEEADSADWAVVYYGGHGIGSAAPITSCPSMRGSNRIATRQMMRPFP
jgi:uncharacterized caspase-like protein